MHYHVSIKSIPEYQVLSLRRIIPTYYAEGDLWKELSSFAAQNQVTVSNHMFSIYHDKEYKEENMGYFSNIAGAYSAFAEWLQKNSEFQMIGEDRQIVHRGPWNERDQKKSLVEIQIPVESS